MKDTDRIAKAEAGLELAGTPEGFDALVAADLMRARGGLALFVARDLPRANAFADSLAFFGPEIEVVRLPAWDCLPYDRISPSPGVAAERMATLTRLARNSKSERPLVVVTTANAAVQRTPPREAMERAAWSTKVGRVVDITELERHFAVNGYQRASTVSDRGECAIRGGVIDVFPPGAEEPVRLDLFGDTLESIRAFDPETQRSTKQLTEVELLPVSEILLDAETVSRFRTRWLELFGAGGDDPIYAAVSEGVRRQGLEHWLPLLHERLETVFDYLPGDAVVLLDAQAEDARDERLAMIEDAYEARREMSRGKGQPAYHALEPKALYLTRDEWAERLSIRPWRKFSPIHNDGQNVIDLGGVQGRTFAAERAQDSVNLFEAVTAHAQALQKDGKRVLFASWTEGASERLGSMLADHGLGETALARDWARARASKADKPQRIVLPVENIDLLTRYGSESEGVTLDRLGGAAWQARKAKAKARLRDMAEGLIALAAKRALRTGEAVDPPRGLFDEFCARFPYEETEDQLNAIGDVLGDLAKGQPMDRLICGDVGFGKTEVALRAAFVSAMSGKQVAVVCPTTLLARQHFKTFADRFAGWPVKIRKLSRMVGTKEAAETRTGLKAGEIDIVVGTHAVLSEQVGFKDLGLVIVDEEQHFGVKHKERLKALRADVHMLTLTATPIPRTLQLALSGIREMSIIATPPVDRLAVRTYIVPFDPVTVREALLREKYRGGQAYYVAPRLSDLPEIERYLREQVPEVKVAVGHGQMSATQLEGVMGAFYEGEFDVLLSTTIVESGLDVPAANTLIVHRADMFGLAQLYQLRGRVGRSKARAFAYLTTPPNKALTVGAERRLRVLQSLDSLGAGFQLASHDLDIRGGGNLLGEEQSGHIKEVGVELYQQMLEDAVQALKSQSGEELEDARGWSPQINAGAAVLIPEDYVPDLNVRLALYRRLSEAEKLEDRESLAAELIDRFGPLPPEAAQLLKVVGVKGLCRQANVAKIDVGPKGAVVAFRNDVFSNPAGLVQLIQSGGGGLPIHPLTLQHHEL